MELRSVRRHRIPAGAADHRPIAHAGAGQFYDKNWLFRAWLHARSLETDPERSAVPRRGAHHPAPRLVCFDWKPAPLLADRLHPGTNALARPFGVGLDGMGYRGHTGHPLRAGVVVAVPWHSGSGRRFTGPYGRCSSWCSSKGKRPGSTS